VPVWVGMGWLETKSGDFLQSKQYTARHSLIRLTRAELKLQLISSIARSCILLHTEIRNSASANSIVAHHTLALLLGTASLAILGFFMRE